jgi:metallopeptidase family M12-like protein
MSSIILRSTCLAASLLVATSASAGDRLTADAMRSLHLADVSVQQLDVPNTIGGPATIDIELEGLPFTLDLKPFSTRTMGFQLYEDPGDGKLITHSPGAVRTVRGEILEDPGSVVAGSLLDDGLHAKIILTSGDMYWIEPLVNQSSNAVFGDHAVYHQDDVLSTPGLCATDRLAPVNDPGIAPPPGGNEGPAGLHLSIAELGCDADFQFFNQYGSVGATSNRINLVINTMNLQYEADVNIRHDISVIIVRTSGGGGGYTSTDPSTLLNQFKAEWTTNQAGQPRDIAHLFTGKNLSGSVIGIAWVGVVCNFSFGYGLAQSNCCGSLSCSTDLSAHEIGHNWNASHCSCSGWTMNSSLTCANQFNVVTIPDIVAHRNSRGCLDEDAGGTVLYSDDFESGNFNAGNWTISNNARCVVKKQSSFTGTWGAKLKKGGVGTGACTVGTDETWIYTPSFSTVGFSTVDVRMNAHYRKNEIGCEQVDVQYSVNGGAWTTFAMVDQHAWAEYSFPVPGAAVGTNDLRIRFLANAKGFRERAEIDDLFIVGN